MKEDNDKELRQIFEEGATPSRDFTRELKGKAVNQLSLSSTRDNFIARIFMYFSTSAFRIGIVAVVFSAALAIPSYVYIARQQQKSAVQVLAKIYEVNQGGSRSKSSRNTALGIEVGNDANTMMMPIEDRKYNYIKTTERYTYGPAASTCVPMVPYHGYVTQNEYVAFYTSKGSWTPDYYKTVSTVGADIYDYALSIKSERWEYRGGKYAVHTINNEPISNLAETAELSSNADNTKREKNGDVTAIDLPDPKNDVNSFFGEGTKILGKTTFNGKAVYKVQWSYSAACEADTSIEKDRTVINLDAYDQKIVVIAFADAQTYAIVYESFYRDAVSSRTLLFTRTQDHIQRDGVELTEVEDEFMFTLAVPIKTVDAAGFDYEKETSNAILDLIQKDLKQVAYLGGQYKPMGLSSQYVSVVPLSQRHLLDRDFYALTSYGTSLYTENENAYKPTVEEGTSYPLFVHNYEGTRTVPNVTVAEFVPSIKGKELLSVWGIDPENLTNVGTVQLILGNQSVSAQVYESADGKGIEPSSKGSFEGEVGQPVTDIMEDPKRSTSKDLYFVFSTGEVSVLVQMTVGIRESPKNIAALLPFKIVSTANRGSLAPLIPQIVSGETVFLPLEERK